MAKKRVNATVTVITCGMQDSRTEATQEKETLEVQEKIQQDGYAAVFVVLLVSLIGRQLVPPLNNTSFLNNP